MYISTLKYRGQKHSQFITDLLPKLTQKRKAVKVKVKTKF